MLDKHVVHMDYLCYPYTLAQRNMVGRDKRKMAMASVIDDEQVEAVQEHRSEADFGRVEFLEIVHVEKPKIIYRSSTKHFFFLAGLAVSSKQCSDSDFGDEHLILPWISEGAKPN